MEYSIKEISKMAGVSSRTLRYYDEIGLLSPLRVSSTGYRIYGQEEVNRLQQILFYREFELPLEKISEIMSRQNYDREKALVEHKEKLIAKRKQIDLMLTNLDESIREMKGETKMKDKDKFQGLKEKNLKVNEEKYGKEIREKYGEVVVEESNRKYQNQSQETYEKAERLGAEIIEKLYVAMETGDPSSEAAQEVAKLHKEWISIYWPVYDKEAHRGLAEMYVADERFKVYYDKDKEGAAEFLRDSINVFTK
ncbi:MerR family transcriptional regulator [Proteiniclasticum sp.]|uniref:MerR family transcriptional regulator n=1 Tax=Proteiniclasticum sp. TaxID=2053595 RepID=UPI002899693A|nr:MerR family transcriptional regulator [Proteiniclasticum sp.]